MWCLACGSQPPGYQPRRSLCSPQSHAAQLPKRLKVRLSWCHSLRLPVPSPRLRISGHVPGPERSNSAEILGTGAIAPPSHKTPGLSDRLRRRRIRATHRRIRGTEEEESGRSSRAPTSVLLRRHAPSPWPWRRPFLRGGGSVRHRPTAEKTPPAPSSQPSAEELRARSRTGTLKFRRNPWHWRGSHPS